MLSEDDATFTTACREDLIVLMSDTAVVTDLASGHLAPMVRLKEYAELVSDFIQTRAP